MLIISTLVSIFIHSFIIYLFHGTNLNISGPRLVSAGFSCNSCGSSSSGSDSKNEPAYAKSNDGANNDGSKTSNKTGVDLKILERKTTSDHNYKLDNNVDTFTPKANKAFKKVKTNISDIWSTDKKEEYATKVEVSGTGNDRVVTIHTGGKTKKFKKDGDTWKEQTEGDQKSGTDQTGTTGTTGTAGTGGANQTSTGGGTGQTGTGTTPS